MSRRSPRSYISRTFPDPTRGRSDTGDMRRRLPGVEDDDRDDAVGLALVIRVVRIHLDQPRPQGVAFLLARAPRVHTAAIAPDLDLGVRRAHEVVEPGRVGVGAALGGDDHQPVTVVEVDQWRDARLAGGAP